MGDYIDYDLLARQGYQAWLRERPPIMAVDTETTGVEYHDRAFCVSVAFGTGSYFFDLDKASKSHDYLRDMLNGSRMVFHNAKFDLQKLQACSIIGNVEADNFEDTEILAHLVDEHMLHGLKPLARRFLGKTTDEEAKLKEVRRKLKLKKADGYDKLPREVLLPYALKDAEFTLALWPILYNKVRVHDELFAYYGMERRLLLSLLRAEQHGFALDLPYLDKTTREYATKLVSLEKSLRQQAMNPEFNPNSPQQVTAAFSTFGIELDNTQAATLEKIEHQFAKDLIELRKAKKIHGTYLLPMLQTHDDGIIHPWFRMNQTRTGRLASGGASN